MEKNIFGNRIYEGGQYKDSSIQIMPFNSVNLTHLGLVGRPGIASKRFISEFAKNTWALQAHERILFLSTDPLK